MLQPELAKHARRSRINDLRSDRGVADRRMEMGYVEYINVCIDMCIYIYICIYITLHDITLLYITLYIHYITLTLTLTLTLHYITLTLHYIWCVCIYIYIYISPNIPHLIPWNLKNRVVSKCQNAVLIRFPHHFPTWDGRGHVTRIGWHNPSMPGIRCSSALHQMQFIADSETNTHWHAVITGWWAIYPSQLHELYLYISINMRNPWKKKKQSPPNKMGSKGSHKSQSMDWLMRKLKPETPWYDGQKHGFRWRFSLRPIQWIVEEKKKSFALTRLTSGEVCKSCRFAFFVHSNPPKLEKKIIKIQKSWSLRCQSSTALDKSQVKP